jgi:hypothetical protein
MRRPGGLEKPQDDYGETRALVFKQRDEIFGGQVSRLQIAQVVGTCIANSELAENKVGRALFNSFSAILWPSI